MPHMSVSHIWVLRAGAPYLDFEMWVRKGSPAHLDPPWNDVLWQVSLLSTPAYRINP